MGVFLSGPEVLLTVDNDAFFHTEVFRLILPYRQSSGQMRAFSFLQVFHSQKSRTLLPLVLLLPA